MKEKEGENDWKILIELRKSKLKKRKLNLAFLFQSKQYGCVECLYCHTYAYQQSKKKKKKIYYSNSSYYNSFLVT